MKLQQSGFILAGLFLGLSGGGVVLGMNIDEPTNVGANRSEENYAYAKWAEMNAPMIVEYFLNEKEPLRLANWDDVQRATRALGITLPGVIRSNAVQFILGTINGLLENAVIYKPNPVFKVVHLVKDVQVAKHRQVYKVFGLVKKISVNIEMQKNSDAFDGLIPAISDLQSRNQSARISLELVKSAVESLSFSDRYKRALLVEIEREFKEDEQGFVADIQERVRQYRLEKVQEIVQEVKEETQLSKILNIVRYVQNQTGAGIIRKLQEESDKLDQQARELMQDPDFEKLAQYMHEKKVRLNSFDNLNKAIVAISSGQELQYWESKVAKMNKEEKSSMLRLYSDAFRLWSQEPQAEDVLASTSFARSTPLGQMQILENKMSQIFTIIMTNNAKNLSEISIEEGHTLNNRVRRLVDYANKIKVQAELVVREASEHARLEDTSEARSYAQQLGMKATSLSANVAIIADLAKGIIERVNASIVAHAKAQVLKSSRDVDSKAGMPLKEKSRETIENSPRIAGGIGTI